MAVDVTNKPRNTLFLLISLDGKISTGDNDSLDVDKDFPRIKGIKEGLHQYYDIEKTTDRVSFNTGRVQEKVGVNTRDLSKVEKTSIDFVIVDNKPHLTLQGSEYFAKRSKIFYLITTNKNHPAYKLLDRYDNIRILYYKDHIDFIDVFRRFRKEFKIKRVTLQTGGTLNAHLLRLGLIDHVSIVLAPALIGGNNTQSLIGGESLYTLGDLTKIRALKLTKCKKLKNSYIHLKYDVINETHIDK